MVGSPSRTVTIPSSRSSRPALTPGILRRPSQITRSRSAATAGPLRRTPDWLACAAGRACTAVRAFGGGASWSVTMAVKAATSPAGAYVTDSMNPRHSTRPRSGSPRTGTAAAGSLPEASPNLGNLRSALGLVKLRGTLRRRRTGVPRKAELEQVARGHRVLAPHHNDLAEKLFEPGGSGTVQRGFPAEDAAEEPAGAVDADEPGHAVALAAVAGRQLGDEFDAEVALGAGRRESLELQTGTFQVHGHGDNALGGLLDLEPELQTFARGNQQGAEVDVAVLVVDFRGVIRSGIAGGTVRGSGGRAGVDSLGLPGLAGVRQLLLFGFPATPKNHGVVSLVVILREALGRRAG